MWFIIWVFSSMRQFCTLSIGQLKMSRVSLAGSDVDNIVPREKIGPKEPTMTAVIFSQNLLNLCDLILIFYTTKIINIIDILKE